MAPGGAGRGPGDSAPYVPRSVVCASEFDWDGDRPPGTALQDSIIYELHVKGFTKLHPMFPERCAAPTAGWRNRP